VSLGIEFGDIATKATLADALAKSSPPDPPSAKRPLRIRSYFTHPNDHLKLKG
jgi:hypothetical protein